MPSLHELKAAIDRGKTARLRLWRSVLSQFVTRRGSLYVKRIQGYRNPEGILVVEPRKLVYEHWDELLDGLGYDAHSHGWELIEESMLE